MPGPCGILGTAMRENVRMWGQSSRLARFGELAQRFGLERQRRGSWAAPETGRSISKSLLPKPPRCPAPSSGLHSKLCSQFSS